MPPRSSLGTSQPGESVEIGAHDRRLPEGEGYLYLVAEDPVGNRAAYLLPTPNLPRPPKVHIVDVR